jgi:hypothetical protein
MHRRRFIALLASAIALPCVAAGQQKPLPGICSIGIASGALFQAAAQRPLHPVHRLPPRQGDGGRVGSIQRHLDQAVEQHETTKAAPRHVGRECPIATAASS